MRNRQEFANLINDRQYLMGAEIGVRDGYFSRLLLEKSGLQRLYSIDPWVENVENNRPDESFQRASNNLKEFNDRSVMLKEFSVDAAKEFEEASLDFIYIDALHDYQSVKEDIITWWPKLKNNGCLAGHDYDKDAWPGVYNAVNEFSKEYNLELLLADIGDNYGEGDGQRQSWYVFKC